MAQRATTIASPPGISATPTRRNAAPTAVKTGIAISAALIPLAYICMHRLAHLNGFIPLLQHLRENGPHYLPLSTPTIYTRSSSDPDHPSYPKYGDPILRVFTGYPGPDYVLGVLNCFFAPVFRDAELTALGIGFTGLFGVVVALVYVEGERKWSGWRRIFAFPTLWCLLFQLCGFGLVMPLYTILYLLSPLSLPTTALNLPPSTSPRIRSLPLSLTLGYLAPTLYMYGSARYASTTTHQQLVAAWQVFPLYIAFFQAALPRLLASGKGPRDRVGDVKGNLESLYAGLMAGSRVCHLGMIAYVASSFYGASEDSSRVPVNLRRLFVPANPVMVIPILSFADGTLQFLQYDFIFGTTAAAVLIWAARRKALGDVKAKATGVIREDGVVERVVTGVLEGPGAVLVKMVWEREAGVWFLGREEGKKAL